MEKKILKYFSMIFTLSVVAALIYKEQYIVAGAISILFLGLAFGMDKIKISKEGVEIEDEK